jgi:hypothetical protein
MTEEQLVSLYRSTKCPPGARPEIDLDTDDVGCFTEDGTRVPPLAPPASSAGIGVLGWSTLAAGAMGLVALWSTWRG